MAFLSALSRDPKIGCQTKNVDFFKVGDTMAMLLLGEKKRLRDVSSWLKRFYGHLRGLRDNLKILHFWILAAGFIEISYRISHIREPAICKNTKNSNYP